MNKKLKAVIAVVLVITLAVSGIGGYVFLFYQPRPVVNDYTAQEATDSGGEAGDHAGGDDTPNTAVFSSGVEFFEEADTDKINASIRDYELTNKGLIVHIDKGTAMDDLGVGDIFFLEGDASTPLGETYIGKIVSVSEDENGMAYLLDDPRVDEVFDVLDFELSEALTADKLSSIDTVEGVTVRTVDSLDPYFLGAGKSNSGYQVVKLGSSGSGGTVTSLGSLNDNGELLIEIELDLLKALGLSEEDASQYQEKYEYQEGERVKVYRNSTGKRYHNKGCSYVALSRHEISLADAVKQNYTPCTKCKPPLLADDEGIYEFKPELTLTGRIGLENIACDVIFDWDILEGKGVENLGFHVNGNYLAEVELKSDLEWEWSGRDTVVTLPLNVLKVQGLKEKMVPVAFLGYNFTNTFTVHGKDKNDQIRDKTALMPLTLALAVYVDMSGKISLSGTAVFNYKEQFDHKLDICRNGEWVWENDYTSGEPTTELRTEVELSGDADVHAGVSVLVYVFNLNPVDVAIAKFGAEAEGTVKVSYSSKMGINDEPISASYHVRTYLKLLDAVVKLKVAINAGPAKVNAAVNLTFTALDITLFECGAKTQTRYNGSEMSYSVVTAQDGEYEYYKDSNGNLIKEKDGFTTTLYSDDFFAICGIDESYIYLLRNSSEVSGAHDIYRVSIERSTSKKIAEGVTNCLMMDENYIYYVTDFDEKTVYRLDRNSLKEESFYHADDPIRYMKPQDDGYYVVTEDSDLFSWFFGVDYNYILLDSKGNPAENYGENPTVYNMALGRNKGYYQAAKIISSGYLRNTAEEVYWLSLSKASHVKVEGISGWHSTNEGIFTTVNNDGESGSGAPYSIVLYRAQDGTQVPVTDVHSNQAFFTLCQSSLGDWYFFDETEDSLVLYTMKKDFSNKTVVNSISLAERPYSLSTCGTTIMNNRIYFYTIPDNSSSTVFYRYDIN